MMRAEYLEPDWLNVSRETLHLLGDLAGMVEKWNPSINLVSKATIPDIWNRHILDSAQIYRMVPNGPALWCDIGSGGGFPGLVMAIMAKGDGSPMQTLLVESDKRKAVFLSEAARKFGLNAKIANKRIEAIAPAGADVVSARALSPLSELCAYAVRHLRRGGTAIFPKGAAAAEEIQGARAKWRFDLDVRPSATGPDASVLILRGLGRV